MTLAEKLAAWKAKRAELKTLRDSYFAKKAEAAAIHQQMQELEAQLHSAEDVLDGV